MSGINLLRNIKHCFYSNGAKFILKNEKSSFNGMVVYLQDNLLYFELFGQKTPLTTVEILNSSFTEFIDKEKLYNKAIKRLKCSRHIKNAEDTYNAIVYLEQEIDYYRSKIKKMQKEFNNDKK